MKNWIMAIVVGLASATGWADDGCGNNSQCPTPCPEGKICDAPTPTEKMCPGSGGTKFQPYTGNLIKQVTDLQIFNGVGESPLAWTRTYHSRYESGYNSFFGSDLRWRHNYNWKFTKVGTNEIVIIDGNGDRNDYNPAGGGVWVSTAGVSDRLTENGSEYILQRQNGHRYHFNQISNWTSYVMNTMEDSMGNAYSVEYNASRDVAKVNDAAGNWLKVTYSNLSTKDVPFHALVTVSGTPPAGWNELAVSTTNAYRFLQFLGKSGVVEIGEMEYYNTATNLLVGTAYGTSPASAVGQEYDKASDGLTNTFFSYGGLGDGFTGIDLGVSNQTALSKIRFYPRSGQESAMASKKFWGANERPETITVISKVETSDGRAVDYGYSTLSDPSLTNQYYQVLTSATYGDGTSASYAYEVVRPLELPLIQHAIDRRGTDQGTDEKYEYAEGGEMGMIKRELNGVTGEELVEMSASTQYRTITWANGAIQTLKFMGGGHLSTNVDGLGRTSYAFYDQVGFGFSTNIVDAAGRSYKVSRSTYGNPLAVIYPDGSSNVWSRNSLESVVTNRDELGRLTIFTRDGLNRVTRTDFPDGTYEERSYNSFGQVTTNRLRNGGIEVSVYSTNGLRTSFTDAMTNTTSYGYNSSRLLVSVTDARSNTTTMGYNERGLMTAATNADGSVRSFAYDANGNKTNEVNELGKSWSWTYDEFKRMRTMKDPLNRVTSNSFDLPGGVCGCSHEQDKPTAITLPSGKVTKIFYDAEWQMVTNIVAYGTADAATTVYQYDALGNVTNIIDPRGKSWSFTFDNRNRRTSATDPNGNQTVWTYDLVGNAGSVKRPDNGITTNSFDSMDRLVSSVDPKNQTTLFSYDNADNLSSIKDAQNNVYTNVFDLISRKVKMGYPDNSEEKWSYDGVGNVTIYTTRAGVTKTCTFDNRNRDTLCNWSDATPDVSKGYDAAGRLLGMTNSASALAFAYNDANEMTSESQNITGSSGGAKTVSYGYNSDGLRLTTTYPDGTVISNGFTGRNQISGIFADGPPPLATYTYDLNGNRTLKVLENGTSTTNIFDNANRITLVNHLGTNGVSFARFDYGYDSVDRRTYVKRDSLLGDVYKYDQIDQVTNVLYEATNPDMTPSSPSRSVFYSHDSVGNRTAVDDNSVVKSYSANNLNQYTSVGSSNLTYSTDGNLTAHGGWSYGYDSQNRLMGATNATYGVSFAYDGRNRCVSRTINGTATYFYFDEWNLIDERNSSNTQLNRYVHGAFIDEILMKENGGGAVYYHGDSIGSANALTSSVGAVVEKYKYDIYGTPSFFDGSGTLISATAYGNRFLFTGREFVLEVGGYDYRNRFYSTELGRFLQTDPIGFDGGDVNLYRYVGNDSLNWVDPYGFQSTPETTAGSSNKLKGKVKRNQDSQRPSGKKKAYPLPSKEKSKKGVPEGGKVWVIWEGAYFCEFEGESSTNCRYFCELITCYFGNCKDPYGRLIVPKKPDCPCNADGFGAIYYGFATVQVPGVEG